MSSGRISGATFSPFLSPLPDSRPTRAMTLRHSFLDILVVLTP